MAGCDWDIVSFAVVDGDSDDESCVSVESFGAVGVAANLLQRGMTAPDVANLAELDEDTVVRLERSLMPEGGAGHSAEDRARAVEERLAVVPEAFLCSLTRELMVDPAVDSSGASYERSAAKGPCHPNPYLKAQIEAFRRDRAKASLAAVPDLMRRGLSEAASRLLARAAELCRPLPAASGLLAEALVLALKLPSSTASGPPLRSALAQALAERRCFGELAAHCSALPELELQEALSREQAQELYSATRTLHECSHGQKERSNRLAAGHVLLAKVDLAMEASAEHELAAQRRKLLRELYELDPCDDFCKQLASSYLTSVPLDQLRNSLESLPLPVLAAAVAYAEDANEVPEFYAFTTFLVAAERSGPEEALGLYRLAASANPKSDSARRGLVKCLLREEQAGTATASMKAELTRALVSQGAFGELARRFEALGALAEVPSLAPADAQRLAAALAACGKKELGAGVAAIAASKYEAAGEGEEALRCFRQAFEWDGGNEGAKAGLKRVGLAFGREKEVALCLLSAARAGAGAAGHLVEAMECVEGALSRAESETLGTGDARVGPLEQALSSLRSSCGQQAAGSIKALDDRVRYVEFAGFRRAELNAKYYKDRNHTVNGRETYWTAARDLFIHMCPDRRSWAIAGQADYHQSVATGRCSEAFARKRHAGLMSPAKWEESAARDHFEPMRGQPTVRGTVALWPLTVASC